MDFISEKKAETKVKRLILLLCLLPQLLRIVLSCIYEYEIAGNHMYPTIVGDICSYGADILGQFSFFSILGSVIYLSSHNGLKRGGEWVILYIGFYIVAYFMLSVIPTYLFGAVAFGTSALISVFAAILSVKKGRGAMSLAVLTLAVPIAGGVVQLYASTVPTVDEMIYVLFYAVANFGFEILFILVASRIADILAKRKGRDISVTGKLVSLRNPILLTMLVFDGIYIVLSALDTTVQIVENLIEYGPPVNASEWMSIIGVYVEYAVVFVIGYSAMRLSAGLIESVYSSAEEKE